ncbi:MAG: PTS sugar transporter subunit IIB [Coriobacteriia bacterium]|nr:PTS sugar transporter subunit IIB [Coriobacteriia bacterium]
MSTSMLIEKMKTYAAEKGIEADIDALPFQRIDDQVAKTDILLLGPQVRHLYKKYTTEYGDRIPVIQIMDMQQYALLKAGEIFDTAYEEYERADKKQE